VTAYRRLAAPRIDWMAPLTTAEAAPALAALSDAERAGLRAAVEEDVKAPAGPSVAAVLIVLSDHSPDCPSIAALPNHKNMWVTEASAAAVLQALLHPDVRRQRGAITERGRSRLERLVGLLSASSSPALLVVARGDRFGQHAQIALLDRGFAVRAFPELRLGGVLAGDLCDVHRGRYRERR
jgi:hypothetical protein